jgi:hypothetical protein
MKSIRNFAFPFVLGRAGAVYATKCSQAAGMAAVRAQAVAPAKPVARIRGSRFC